MTAISVGRWCASTVVPLVSRALLSLSFGKVLAGAGLVWIAAAFITGGGHARIAEPTAHAAATDVTLAAATTADLGTGGEAIDDSGLTDWTTMSGGGRPAAATGTVSDVTDDEELPSWSDTLGQRPAGNRGGHSAQNSTTRESIGGSPDSLIDPVLEFIHGVVHKVTGAATSSAADDVRAGAIQDFVRNDPTDRPRVQRAAAAPASSGSGPASRTRSTQLAGDISSDISSDIDELVSDQLTRAGVTGSGRASNTGTSQATRVPPPGQGVDELFTSVVDLASGIVSTVAGREAGQRTRQALSKAADQLESALARGAALNRDQSNAGAGSNAAQWGATDPRPTRQSAKGHDLDQTREGSGGGHKVTDGTAAARTGRATGCTLDDSRGCEAAATVRDDVLSALRGRGPPAQRTDSPGNTHDGLSSGKNSGTQNSGVDEWIESAAARLSSRITSLVTDFVSGRLNTGAPAGGKNSGTGPATGGQSGSGQGNTGSNAGGAAGGIVDGVLKLVGQAFSEVGQLLQQIGGKSAAATGQSGSRQGVRPGQSASNPVDQLTKQITQVVQNWLVSNGLTGSTRQPAPTSTSAQTPVPTQAASRRPSAAQTSPPQDSEQSLPVVAGSGSGRHTATSNGSGAAASRVPAGQGVDELLDSMVNLASGIVSTVAGREAGQRTHRVLSLAADELESALVKGAALNRGRSGTGTTTSGWATTTPRVAHPEAERQGDRGDGDGGRGPAAGPVPTSRGITGCDADGGRACDLVDKVGDTVYSALRGRGPPAMADDSRNNSGDGPNGRAVRLVGQFFSQVGQFLDQLGDSMSSSANGRPGSVSNGQSARGTVPQQPGQVLSASINEPVNAFIQDLFQRLGMADPKRSGGSVEQQARQTSGGDDLARSIRESTNDFVQNLLKDLGIGQSQRGSGGSGNQSSGNTVDNTGGNGSGGGEQTGGWQSSLGAEQGQFAGTECQSDAECALAGGSLRTRQPSGLGSRAPPPLLADDTQDQYQLVSWDGYSSPTATNQALDDHLAVINGQKSVDEAKAALAKGSITQADYDKKVAAQKALQTKADGSMGQLSDHDSQLITDTVTGQQKLAAAKTALDKDSEQLEAGKLDKATYDERAAAYAAQRDEVYGQTERLRWATGGSQPSDPNAGRGGAGAACSSTGAFGECATVAEDAETGKTERDRSLCLTGISTCASSSTVGDRTASASCDLTGCKTTSEAGKTTASTTCGAGECNTATVADSRGADTFCQAKAGCTTSGKTPTTPDAADLAAGKREGPSEATGTCTKNCALASFATKSEAGSDCNTSNGVCDTNSTGRRATETKPTGETPAATDTTQPAASKTPAKSTEASKENGEASSTAHCAATTVGCDVSAGVRAGVTENGQRGWLAQLLYGDDENTTTSRPAAQASARCAHGATGCTGNTETSTGGKTEKTTTTSATPAVPEDPETGQTAVAAKPAKTNTAVLTRSGKAGCEVKGGSCTSSSGLGDGEDVLSYSGIDCDQAKGCTGTGTTATHAEVSAGVDGKTATRKTDANHECTVAGSSGGCSTDASSTAANNGTNLDESPTVTLATSTGTDPAAKTDPVAELGKGLTAYSRTDSTLECGSKDCTTSAKGATSGEASGDVKGVRDSNGTTTCEAHGVGGTCGSVSDTEVAHREAQPDANGKPATPAGPLSVSHADAQVRCADSTQCGGKSSAATSARDTGISEHRRGSSTTADCTVKGGGCLGQASSDASTVAEYIQLDPKTGQPIKGQPTSGPTSTSRSAASVDCRSTTCSGTAHTTSAAFDGAVADGKPRTSEGTVDCQTGSGSCQVQTLSTATTGPGAARAYADGDVNAARMPAGPSAASVVGGKMTCEGTNCTGKIIAAVTATDPTVSPDPRGSRGVGTCSGVSGGTCHAVVNGAASSGQDANSIAPMVRESSTDNATVTSTNTGGASDEGTTATSGKDAQGSTASRGGKNSSGHGGQNSEQPATAPGSSANSGGPTVPGASSWSSASATLTCDGSGPCKGTPRGVATGIDGPNNHNGAAGSRGPPEASGTTTSTCDTTGSACQAVSSSSSASGQVVADIYTEQYRNAATQATTQATEARQAADQAAATAALPGATAEQRTAATEAATTADEAKKTATAATEAAKKPIPADALPATWSQSSSAAQCTGPGCTATTTGDTSGIPGASHTDATCTSTSSGCAVTSDATATLMRDSGQLAKVDKNDKDGTGVPGFSGEAETGSTVICPEAGCTGKVTGKAKATAGRDGHSSVSTGEGDTACDGSGECNAGIRASVSAAYSAPGVTQDQQFATTTATIAASCDNATSAGCPIHATSTTDSVGALGVKSTTTATCHGGVGCMTGTSGTATPDMSQVSFQCGGSGGCTASSEGKAEAGKAKANAANDCTVGANGQCAGSVQVGASEDGSALAGASCQATSGARCHYSYEASSSDSAVSGGAKANANAHGSKSGEMGGGAVQVMAKTIAKDGTAQAAASCHGTEGTDCDYHFEASASSRSSDPSAKAWAKADAHGSEDGKMGGGAIQVMAKTYANGADANAQSTCVGAKNCSSTYSAHAEAHDRANQAANAKQPDMPSGYWLANGAGTCSGSGKGGCGVHAWANAGPGGSGGASCSGDCSGFSLEQSGNSFTQTGPSWNQIQAARATHQVKDLDEFMNGLKPGESAIGYQKTKDGYDIYTKDGDGPVKIDKCSTADCAPGKKIEGGGGQIVIPLQGNPETSRPSAAGHDPHKCDASVGCALSGDNSGKGDGRYWIEGDGNVTDGITASTLHYQDSKPAGNYPANRNEGSFGNTQGKPFTFTCNGGCTGEVSNIDLGKGKFTDKIDIQNTPNLLVGRNGLGNLGDYSHYGPGTVTLEGRDHKMMEPISSDTMDGLTPQMWADVTTKYGYTPWDVPTLKKVLGNGDTLTGFVPDGHGGISIVTKDADGDVQSRPCGPDECRGGKPPIVGGGNGTVEFGANGDGTITQPSVDGKDTSTCTSSSTCGIAATADGAGMWWLNGNGNVHDGASRSVVTYSGQYKNTANGGTLANHADLPFTASCAQGCTADVGFAAKPGDKLDHFDLNDATGVQITARDADGHAGVIKWAGKGHFQGVEGDKVWADQKKAAWNPDEETKESSDNATLIITRDAAGNPGYYALPTGQSGRIETKEGYVVDNRHHDQIDSGDHSPEDAYNYQHMGDVLKVTTPNGEGKGGTLECGGSCTVSGPGLPAQNTPCAQCHWVEHLATGEGPHPGGYREVTNLGEKKTWYTPTGDEQTCDGCAFTQYNRDSDGNGGGAVCTGVVSGVNAGAACSGRSREGTTVSDPEGTRLLYANADGSHTGWSCKSNQDSCGTDGKNLRFDWGPSDTTNSYWALAMDGGFRRPPTDSPIDKSMAEDLGLKSGDALPALDADALARMKAQDAKNGTNHADQYAMNLPKLTSSQQDGMAFEYLNQQSTDRRLQNKYGDVYSKVKPVAEAYRNANSDGVLTGAEKADLDKKFGTLDGIDPGDVYDWSAARGVIDGVADANYVRPDINKTKADMAENPDLVNELAGPAQPGDTRAPMDRALDNVKSALGVDDKGSPNAPYNTSQNSMLSLRPIQTQLDTMNAGYARDVADFNSRALAFRRDGGSDATREKLNAEQQTLDARSAQITAGRDLLNAATEKIQGPKDPDRDAKQATLRTVDEKFGRGSGDTAWVDRITSANSQLNDITALYNSLDQNDPQQKKWAEKLGMIKNLSALNYTAVTRNMTERAPGNPIDRLELPSTGKQDLLFALTSAKNRPGYQNWTEDDLSEEFTKLSPDELAQRASQMSAKEYQQSIRGRDMSYDESPDREVNKKAADSIRRLGGADGQVDAERMLYRKGSGDDWVPTMLYRVRDADGTVLGWIDADGSKYSSLDDYQNHNSMAEDSDLITRENWKDANSPLKMTSAHYTSPVEKAMDYVIAPAMIIGGTIATFTGVGAVVGVPLIAGGTTWFVGKASINIYQRSQHWQSNSWSNPAAAADYLSLGATALVGAGAFLRPLAVGASVSVRAAAAAPGVIGMSTFTGMYAANVGSTVINWETMTPGQRGDAIAGLVSGGLMLASPAVGKGLRAGLDSGRIPGGLLGIRDGSPMRPMVGTNLSRPAIDVLGDVMRPGRPVPLRDVLNHTGLTEGAVRNAVGSGRGGSNPRFRLTEDSSGNILLDPGGRVRPGAEGIRIRDIVSRQGVSDGNGGKTMTVDQVRAELRHQGVRVPSDAAISRMMGRIDGASTSGRGSDMVVSARAAEGTFRTVAEQAPARPAETGAPEAGVSGATQGGRPGDATGAPAPVPSPAPSGTASGSGPGTSGSGSQGSGAQGAGSHGTGSRGTGSGPVSAVNASGEAPTNITITYRVTEANGPNGPVYVLTPITPGHGGTGGSGGGGLGTSGTVGPSASGRPASTPASTPTTSNLTPGTTATSGNNPSGVVVGELTGTPGTPATPAAPTGTVLVRGGSGSGRPPSAPSQDPAVPTAPTSPTGPGGQRVGGGNGSDGGTVLADASGGQPGIGRPAGTSQKPNSAQPEPTSPLEYSPSHGPPGGRSTNPTTKPASSAESSGSATTTGVPGRGATEPGGRSSSVSAPGGKSVDPAGKPTAGENVTPVPSKFRTVVTRVGRQIAAVVAALGMIFGGVALPHDGAPQTGGGRPAAAAGQHAGAERPTGARHGDQPAGRDGGAKPGEQHSGAKPGERPGQSPERPSGQSPEQTPVQQRPSADGQQTGRAAPGQNQQAPPPAPITAPVLTVPFFDIRVVWEFGRITRDFGGRGVNNPALNRILRSPQGMSHATFVILNALDRHVTLVRNPNNGSFQFVERAPTKIEAWAQNKIRTAWKNEVATARAERNAPAIEQAKRDHVYWTGVAERATAMAKGIREGAKGLLSRAGRPVDQQGPGRHQQKSWQKEAAPIQAQLRELDAQAQHARDMAAAAVAELERLGPTPHEVAAAQHEAAKSHQTLWQIIWNWVNSRTGWISVGTGVVFTGAVIGAVAWPIALPAIAAMVAFQVRGTLNTAKPWLSNNKWAQRITMSTIVVTLTVNLPLHIRGTMDAASTGINRWIAALFGVGDVTTLTGALVAMVALWSARDISTITANKFWAKVTARAGLVGALATLASIPLLVIGTIIAPDSIQSINLLVYGLTVATFFGFGGEAAYLLGEKAWTMFGGSAFAKGLTKFVTVFSAATIAAYGMLYQLHSLPTLLITTGALAVGLGANWFAVQPARAARILGRVVVVVVTAGVFWALLGATAHAEVLGSAGSSSGGSGLWSVLSGAAAHAVMAGVTAAIAALSLISALRSWIQLRGPPPAGWFRAAVDAAADIAVTAAKWVRGPTGIASVLSAGAVAVAFALGPITGVIGLIAFAVRGGINLAKARFTNLPTWASNTLTTAFALSWVVNLLIHLPAVFTAPDVVTALVNGLFAAADILFLVAAIPAATNALFGAPLANNRFTRAAGNLAFPTITLAAGLLGVQLGFLTGPWIAAIPIVTLTLAFGYLTQGKLAGTGWTWWTGTRVLKFLPIPAPAITAALSLAGYGLLRLWTEHLSAAVPTSIGLVASAIGLWAINSRGPPARMLGRVVVLVVATGVFWVLFAGTAYGAVPGSVGSGWWSVVTGSTAQTVVLVLTVAGVAVPLISALRSWIRLRGPPQAGWFRAAASTAVTAIPTTIALITSAIGLWAINPRGPTNPGGPTTPLGSAGKHVVTALKWLVSRTGLSSVFTAGGLVGSYLIVDAHPLPGWLGMVAFAVRGLLNWLPVSPWFAESFLLKDKADGTHTWLKSVLNTLRPITQLININLLVLGMLPLAFISVDYWVNAMFVVANAGFVIIGVPAAIASWNGNRNPAEASKVWAHVVRWSTIVAFAAVIVSIPLMGIQLTEPQWHLEPTQFLLIWSTYLGWLGESVFEIRQDFAAKRAVKKGTNHVVPQLQKRFWAKFSAVSLVVYGIVYLLPNTPVLVGTSGALVVVTAVLMWVINRHAPPASRVTVKSVWKALGSPIGRTAIGYALAGAAVAVVIAVGPIPGYVVVGGLIAFAARGTVNVLNLWLPKLPRWVKAGLATLVAVSWLVNLTLHLPSAFATGGLPALINGLFAAADALFLVAALPSATKLLVKAHAPDNQITRWTTWLAFPTITLAAGLLGYQLGFLTGPWIASIPIATLTAGFGYLTQTKLADSPFGARYMGAWKWWSGSRFAPGALVTANVSLAGYGLLRLWTEHRGVALPATISLAGAVVAVLGVAIGMWAINRRGPNPPGGSSAPGGPPGPAGPSSPSSSSGPSGPGR